MNEQYLITKCVLNEDNLLIFFPTEILDSMNESNGLQSRLL